MRKFANIQLDGLQIAEFVCSFNRDIYEYIAGESIFHIYCDVGINILEVFFCYYCYLLCRDEAGKFGAWRSRRCNWWSIRVCWFYVFGVVSLCRDEIIFS